MRLPALFAPSCRPRNSIRCSPSSCGVPAVGRAMCRRKCRAHSQRCDKSSRCIGLLRLNLEGIMRLALPCFLWVETLCATLGRGGGSVLSIAGRAQLGRQISPPWRPPMLSAACLVMAAACLVASWQPSCVMAASCSAIASKWFEFYFTLHRFESPPNSRSRVVLAVMTAARLRREVVV